MYSEIEQYYSNYFKSENITHIDRDEMIMYTMKFYQLSLLTSEEYYCIMAKLDGKFHLNISSLNISARAHNALNRGSTFNYLQLRALLTNEDGQEKLFSIRNIGKKTYVEIFNAACRQGIVTYEEIYNAGWTSWRKNIIDDILKSNLPF